MFKEKTFTTAVKDSEMKFIFEEGDKTNASQDLKDMTYTVIPNAVGEETKESSIIQEKEDLITSAPIMNKKIMHQNIQEMGKA